MVHQKSEKFPEAFDRFEKEEKPEKNITFQQLFFQVMLWGKEHTPMTEKQTKALKIEAINKGYGKSEFDENVNRYRNVISGRFTKKPEYIS